jgi:hypothetical protein
MIDASTSSPSSPRPALAEIYQDQNDDTLTDYFLPFTLESPQYIGLRGATTMRK